jgi:FkbM family methyltransferase
MTQRSPTSTEPTASAEATHRAPGALGRAALAASRLGLLPMLQYDAQRLRRALGIAPSLVQLRARRAMHPLLARPSSTDLKVFAQTFVSEPYACLDDIADVELIVDCGANVGFASAFLLSQFPKASLIALEPDPDNFALLERNLAPYGARATALQAGVWSHNTRLRIVEEPYRGGGAWARQVREVSPHEASGMEALDIPEILRRSGRDRISILKMDIEGSECVVFAAPNVDTWLSRVDCLAVELHDDTHFGRCTDIFSRAIADEGFALSRSRELTVARRRSR